MKQFAEVVMTNYTYENGLKNYFQARRLYGIAIDDWQYLLEDGTIADSEYQNIRSVRDCRGQDLCYQFTEIQEFPTDNIPPKIKESLEEGLNTYFKLREALEEINELSKNANRMTLNIANDMTARCRKARTEYA